MSDACNTFRIEHLSGDEAHASPTASHAASCADCARFVAAVGRQRGALAELARLGAPDELEARVAAELGGNRTQRNERAMSGLVRRVAPALLDELVAERLARSAGDEVRGRDKARAVGALETQTAPSVLERLVEEELAQPEGQLVARVSGNLERVHAPAALERRLAASVRRRAIARLVLGPLVPLAAAVLVVWFAVEQGEAPRERRFEVVQATSLDQLDPMARALAESLGGGVPR